MNDPYQVLGVSPDSSDEQVKSAYRALAKKYHPDNYSDNPLSDLAQEKMQEINDAYDTIMKQRKSSGGYYGGYASGGSTHSYAGSSSGSSQYADVRRMINGGRLEDAEQVLDGVPGAKRDAEWYFLKGSILYRKGWIEDAYNHFTNAARMDPGNMEYQSALHQMQWQRQQGSYRSPTGGGYNTGGCSGCDVCSSLMCADCCCECMGGDLIRCC